MTSSSEPPACDLAIAHAAMILAELGARREAEAKLADAWSPPIKPTT